LTKYIKGNFNKKGGKDYYWFIDENNSLLKNIKIGDFVVIENAGADKAVKIIDIFESDTPPYEGKIKKVIKPFKNNRKQHRLERMEFYKSEWNAGKGKLPKKIILKKDGNQKELKFASLLNYLDEYYFYKALVKGTNIKIKSKKKSGEVCFVF